MGWGKPSPGFDSLGCNPMGPDVQSARARYETVELVGPRLRVSGEVSLANFVRLSDMINHNRGYIRLKEARLLRRNGEPTDLIVPELMVNQDEVTFVGQSTEAASPAPADRERGRRRGDGRRGRVGPRRFNTGVLHSSY
ncbi:MAG: hypothetical protein ABSC46_07250 [Candidatus Limnocylindrales bacterium]